MQTATAPSIEALRSELRRVEHGRMMSRVWHRARHEWQRVADRASTWAIRGTGQSGVAGDRRIW